MMDLMKCNNCNGMFIVDIWKPEINHQKCPKCSVAGFVFCLKLGIDKNEFKSRL